MTITHRKPMLSNSSIPFVPSGERKAVIIFTDGQENSSTISRDEMISKALKSNVVVCAVDFGCGINERRLKNSYVIEYPVRDYGSHNVAIKLCWGKDTATSRFTYDNTPDVGAIALLNVNFEFGKATLDANSTTAVTNTVTLMKAFPKLTLEVRGHTDNTNSTKDVDYNSKLSQKRAESVRDAIVRGGIKQERVFVKGCGEGSPVATNGTEEGRAQNRRTEFILLTC